MSPLPPKRLLLIQDRNPELFDFARRLAGDHATQVYVARSQVGGLEMAKRYQPRIIIVAANMTSIYGRSFISLLREANPLVSIIIPQAEPTAHSAVAS